MRRRQLTFAAFLVLTIMNASGVNANRTPTPGPIRLPIITEGDPDDLGHRADPGAGGGTDASQQSSPDSHASRVIELAVRIVALLQWPR
jgi:hypothetical protein